MQLEFWPFRLSILSNDWLCFTFFTTTPNAALTQFIDNTTLCQVIVFLKYNNIDLEKYMCCAMTFTFRCFFQWTHLVKQLELFFFFRNQIIANLRNYRVWHKKMLNYAHSLNFITCMTFFTKMNCLHTWITIDTLSY